MNDFLAANWLRIIISVVLLSILVWVLVQDYRFRREPKADADPSPRDWWGA